MSINAYVGLPGSGKSYGVVENLIIPALKKGRPVYTNIPLNNDAIGRDFDIELVNYLQNQEMEESQGASLLSIPGGALIVMDEVWRIFPAGLKANEIPKATKEFLAEHRHKAAFINGDNLTQEIALIVQDLGQIANYVRGLVDKTFVASKLDAVSAKTKYRIDVYQGAQKGPKYSKDMISTFYGKYKPEIYQYYKSHTKSESGLAGMERAEDNRATVWKHPLVKYGLPVAFIALFFGIRSILGFFTSTKQPGVQTQTAPAIESKPPPPVNTQPTPPSPPVQYQPPPRPPESKRWRLSGYIGSPYGKVFLIENSKQGRLKLTERECVKRYGEYECLVDGEIVASYTGQPEHLEIDPLDIGEHVTKKEKP